MESLMEFALGLAALVASIGLLLWVLRPDFAIYEVRREDADEHLPGIPFYVKKASYVQRTSYLERQLELSLRAVRVVESGGEERTLPLFSGTTVVRWPDQAEAVDALETLLDEIPGSTQVEVDLAGARKQFRSLESVDRSALDLDRLVLERNWVEQQIRVDYSTEYYVNRRQPRSGSAEATVELGADGTLSKATASVSDTELSTLAGMIPTAKLMEKLLSPPADDTTRGVRSFDSARAAARVEVTWERKPVLVRHTLTTTHEDESAFSQIPSRWPPVLGDWAGGYSRELVDAVGETPPAAEKECAREDSNPQPPDP